MSATTATAPAGREALRVLASVLDLLAEVYLEPASDVRERAARLAEGERAPSIGVDDVVAGLRRLGGAAASDLEVEYVRLFLHGRPLTAHPYESFYRGGLLADEACLADLEALLREAGVEPGGNRVTPDHLGVELDLLALLLAGLADQAPEPPQREAVWALADRLLADHLTDFVAAFVARVRSLGPDPYHLAASHLLADSVASAARLVLEMFWRSDVGPLVDPRENHCNQPQTRH